MCGAMEIQVYLFREGVMEKKFEKNHMQRHGNCDFPFGRHLQDPGVGLWNSMFFFAAREWKKFREPTCKAIKAMTFY